MVKDRTTELREKSRQYGNIYMETSFSAQRSPPPPLSAAQQPPTTNTAVPRRQSKLSDLNQFTRAVNETRANVNLLSESLKEISEIHASILASPDAKQELTMKLNDRVEKFKRLSQEVSGAIRDINEEAKRSAQQESDAMARIKKNQAQNINKDLVKIVSDFNKEQIDYKAKCQKRINNYLAISGIRMDEEEIDRAIESGQLFNTVQFVMGEKEKRMLFEDIKNRHDDILKLERSIREIHEMFQDMSMLVEAQGEMVDRIDTSVENAREYAQNALRNVEEARKSRNRAIRMKIGIIICLVITAIFLFLFLAGAFCLYFPFICHR